MDARWSQTDVFPLIAQAIRECHSAHQRFVTHDEIVQRLLKSPDATSLIEAARGTGENDRSADWLVHNMVAWFSQRITMEESEWSKEFDRERIDGKWAYLPKGT